MQRENELGRVVVSGKRTDDGGRCDLLAVQETGGSWALYPHGACAFGARISAEGAATLARAILGGAR